jgi:hypothetical protein
MNEVATECCNQVKERFDKLSCKIIVRFNLLFCIFLSFNLFAFSTEQIFTYLCSTDAGHIELIISELFKTSNHIHIIE